MKIVILIMAFAVIWSFGLRKAMAQFTVKIPKLPKIEKAKDSPSTQRTDPSQTDGVKTSDRSSNPSTPKSGSVVYGSVYPDATPRLVKDSIYVQAVTAREYWKAPGQSGYHSWAPRIRFDIFYNNERKLKFTADYYNPDGTLWFTEPLEDANSMTLNTFQSDRTNTEEVIGAKGSVAAGLYGFKIKETTTGQTFYEGKFKVGKFLPPYKTKNQFEFFVDHDWELPIGIISFEDSNFHNFGENIGGFEMAVSMWFKGDLSSSDHGLEARLFYRGQQIATTAAGQGAFTSDGERITGFSALAADLYHWKRWKFWWKRVIVDNGGTFNRENYPDAYYLDKNPGDYVVKVFRNGAQVCEASFSVAADGRVVDAGYYKPGYLTYHKVVIPVRVVGVAEKWNATAWKTEAFYGNPSSGFVIP